MQTIALFNVPDQTFTTQLDDDRYVIRVFQLPGTMACDISRNETQIISGQRITPGEMLIPFFAYQGLSGTFILLTQNDELPDYAQFGITQTLVYMTLREMLNALI